MSVLNIQLFGHFAVSLDGVALVGLHTVRLQSLFARLVLHPQVFSRRYLAFQLWPDSNEAQARTNLRNLVHLLRQTLPEFERFILADAQTLQWRTGAAYRLDVVEFEQLLALFSPTSPDPDRLARAVALYQGDLLPDCYEDWIIPQRDRLRQSFLSALEALVKIAEVSRDYPMALRYAHRLVQEDPLHATANFQMIHLQALNGNLPAALKAYQDFARHLERELGISPDQQLQDLYARLKNQEGANSLAVDRPIRTMLVGRHAEWARLKAVWARAALGGPQAVFISGESGIGKTRLVEELVEWVSRQGLRVAVAHCYPVEGSLPYAPVVTWLRSRPLPHLENFWLMEIARLMPDALAGHSGSVPPKPITESWQRQRMFEALALAVLGKPAPTLLVIEDIHWCDQDTLEWLHYLLRYDVKYPLLIVATERSEETVATTHPIKKLQAALTAADKYTGIQLSRLNEAESIQLATGVAAQTSGVRAPVDDTAQIFRETEGNPLFIVEMIRLGGLQQVQPPVEIASFSEKIRAILEWRINQLSTSSRELACLAATLGREFPFDVLRQASGLAEAALVKALDELLLRQIVQEQPHNRYDFVHEKLRQAVLHGLSGAHQRLLHRQAAEAYLAFAGETSRLHSAEIASHYESAGLALPAIHYYRMAAAAAARLFSTVDAIQNLERAIALSLELSEGVAPDELAQMLEALGDLLALDGKDPSAQRCYEQALKRSKSLSGRWRAQVFRKISDILVAQYQRTHAHMALDQAEQALHESSEGECQSERQEWLQIQLARLQLLYWENQPDRMAELMAQVEPVVHAMARIDQQITWLRVQCDYQIRRERYRISPETLEIGRCRLELSETLDDPVTLASAQFYFGFLLLWSGNFARAQDLLSKGYTGATQVGARLWRMRSLSFLCIANRKLNYIDAVREQSRLLLELPPDLRDHTYHGVGLANSGWLAWQEGDLERAECTCKKAIAVWNQFGGHAFQALAYWVLLAVALQRGDLVLVEEYARMLLDSNPKYRPVEEAMASKLSQAIGICQAGEGTRALACFSEALKMARAAAEL